MIKLRLRHWLTEPQRRTKKSGDMPEILHF